MRPDSLESLESLSRSCWSEPRKSRRVCDAERRLDVVDQHAEEANVSCGAEDLVQRVAKGASLNGGRSHRVTSVSIRKLSISVVDYSNQEDASPDWPV